MARRSSTYSHYLQEIKKGNVENSYLLVGNNDFLKSSFINFIEPQFINPAFVSIDKIVTYGETLNTDTLSWLWLMPMASKKKILIIKDAENISKDIIQKIQDYIDKPSTTSILLLLINDPKKEKLFKDIEVINFEELREYEIKSWVTTFLKEKGFSIENKGIELLQELFSNDLQLICTELDKLISFIAPSNLIKASDVEAMESYELEGSIFNLMDAIGSKEFTKSIHLLSLLLSLKDSSGGEKAGKILWMISQHFEKLLKVKKGQKDIYYLDKLTKQAKLWEEKELISVFDKLFEAEFSFKTGKADVGFLLNKLIYNLCY